VINAMKRTIHEFDGKKYRRAASHQREWGNRLIEDLGLKGHEHVLDLGCGDGALTKRLAALVPGGRCVGIDASEGMIRAARALEGGNLEFRRLDVRGLEYRNDFDVVFSNASLHWILDHRVLLAAVRRALRAGGVFRASFAGRGNCRNFIRAVKTAMRRPAFNAQFSGFEWPWFMPGKSEYQRVADAAGFRDCRVWLENADRTFPDSESITAWIDQPGLVPFLSALREPAKTAFRDYVVRTLLAETRREDGTYFETFRRIHVRAEK
jgi:trans-aconitate 2-methyltransferase